jgi:hypothetical protein
MAFDQYTRCVKPADFVPRSFTRMVTQAGALAFALGVVPVLTGDPICLLIAAEIGGLVFIVIYCRNFLYERLICLGDGSDVDVIGAVISVSPPVPAYVFDSSWPDDDYSINLLLPCNAFGATKQNSEDSLYGDLVAPNDAITNPPVALGTAGHDATDKFGTGKVSWGLHAEFEGAGVYALLQAYEALLGFAVLAYLACMFVGFPTNLILAGIVFLLGLIGLGGSRFAGPGQPSDVTSDPDLQTIHANDEDNGGNGRGADLLYVKGTWVFDPLHDGWNEIHPVKRCTKFGTGTWEGQWPIDLCVSDVILKRLRDHFDVAEAAETQANQALPQHRWQVHPEIDGCAEVVIT